VFIYYKSVFEAVWTLRSWYRFRVIASSVLYSSRM
jgi:hypothetical protein